MESFFRNCISSLLGLFNLQTTSAELKDAFLSVEIFAPASAYNSSEMKTLSPNPFSMDTSIPKSINFLATSGKMVARISCASSFGKNICIISLNRKF